MKNSEKTALDRPSERSGVRCLTTRSRAWERAKRKSVNLQRRPEIQTVLKQTARANIWPEQKKIGINLPLDGIWLHYFDLHAGMCWCVSAFVIFKVKIKRKRHRSESLRIKHIFKFLDIFFVPEMKSNWGKICKAVKPPANNINYLNILENTVSGVQVRNPWWAESNPTFCRVNGCFNRLNPAHVCPLTLGCLPHFYHTRRSHKALFQDIVLADFKMIRCN